MKCLALIVRYLNEPFLDEFVEYYLSEGVDNIFILYDVDSTIPISDNVKSNKKITIIESTNFKHRQTHDVNNLFMKIKSYFKWIIFVDCDEFITTFKNQNKTIRQELESTFKNVDCIKIPWIMMSSNDRKHDPPSILQYLTTRWDHDKRHPHPNNWPKGRCRYNEIEVKSISKCDKINELTLHHPITNKNIKCIDSVLCNDAQLTPFYKNLRENEIHDAYFLCYHYRIFSLESSKRKMINNKLDGYKMQNLNFLLQSDYSELHDDYMKQKSIYKFGEKK
tara:strand:+ start:352 stop:1188 length:837 start_codon:yes stop_codon:yes gene_type:complete